MLPDVSMLIDFARMVIEIAILALVIYKILYYMRGARGSYVLAGIIILLVALIVISQYLKLEAINFLLQWLLVSLPTALFIIFQPELRRAFAQLGSYTVFQGKRRREVIGELVTATANMAKRKCGALMVVERRIGMQALIDDSVRLDIKINAMVLESIFFPNSPLHDGAVIIHDDRIVAARAILPLTRAENISRRLGTRHRAALGISEETGTISIACRGVLHRDLAVSELENYLEKLIIQEQDDTDLAETVQMLEEQSEQPSAVPSPAERSEKK